MFEEENCIADMFKKLQDLKGEPKKITKNYKNKSLLNMNSLAHDASGFENWILLNNLPDWCRITIMIKIGKGIINVKIYNGVLNVNSTGTKQHKGQPQYHMKSSLKKIRRNIQTSIFTSQKRN